MLATHLTRYWWGLGLAPIALLASGEFARAETPPAPRPNFVIIVADDLGYHDLGFQGGTQIPTPQLDRLAAAAVRCTSGYVSCPVCSPTRAGLLTGRYQQRFGHEHNPGGPEQTDGTDLGLPVAEKTLADRLAAVGYRTGLVGKWHLGSSPQFRPRARGFHEYFGFLGGARSYFTGANARNRQDLWRNDEPTTADGYLTELLAQEAVEFIHRHRAEPFLLCLTFNAVHNPLEASDRYLERFPSVTPPGRRKYAAMLSAMDDAVGRVTAALAEEGLAENTVVFFLSDNGGPPVNFSDNGPLHGFKSQLWEGGIRVPFLVSWPGHLPTGEDYAAPVISLDIAPTCLALAAAPVTAEDRLDGLNLLPHLSGETTEPPHQRLFWRFGPGYAAVREGPWKLLREPEQPDRLYNLETEIGETTDWASREPARVAELAAALDAWNAELRPPLWKHRGRAVSRAAEPPTTDN